MMAAQRKSRSSNSALTTSFYRRIASQGWRGSNYFTYSSSSPAFRRWLGGEIGEEPLRILSIGCGSGEFECALAEAGHQVLSLDLSHAMLKRGLRLGLEFPVEADARHLPLLGSSCHVVLFPESIGHLPLGEVFAEAHRVLKRRGRVMVTTYASHLQVQKDYRKYGFDDMVPALEDAGFHVRAQRFLKATRSTVTPAASDTRATLLYLAASK